MQGFSAVGWKQVDSEVTEDVLCCCCYRSAFAFLNFRKEREQVSKLKVNVLEYTFSEITVIVNAAFNLI